MSKNPSDARSLEYLNKQVKKLKKSEIFPHRHDCQTAVAQDFGFPAWDNMVAYVRGRPRRENGGIVISETPGLTLEQALNERAALHGMPPIGTQITNEYGIDAEVVNYDFFRTPTTVARYPGDCDYLPIVALRNASQRLNDFFAETDRCTSKRIVLIDLMPRVNPLKLGQNIHIANYGGDPEESYIYLDLSRAAEFHIAHEAGHLWIIYVEGGDGCRVLKDKSDSHKANILDFIQSFVLDLKVNDLVEKRGFDMAPLIYDQLETLLCLRDLVLMEHQPPSCGEAITNTLSIAGAILEQHRWPTDAKQALGSIIDFFETTQPKVYVVAKEFVEIIRRCGYDDPADRKRSLDECIMLGFTASGYDFDLERDLREPQLNESMQDKYPEQFPGLPVPLKLEIGKTMARHGISGEGRVSLSKTSGGMAQITVEDGDGNKIGPLPVNYRLTPYPSTAEYQQMYGPNRVVAGKLPDQFGRLPGEIGYNPGSPPGSHPLELAANLVNGMMPDDFGRLPGEPGYNTTIPPDLGAFSGMNVTVVNGHLLINGRLADQHGRLPGHPQYNSSMSPDRDPLNDMLPHMQVPASTMAAFKRLPGQQWPAAQNQHMLLQAAQTPQNVFAPVPNPQQLPIRQAGMLPEPEQTATELTHRYMAGVGLSVARARLIQQLDTQNINLYQYALNNPVNYVDPDGNTPILTSRARGGKPRPVPNCPPDVYKALVQAQKNACPKDKLLGCVDGDTCQELMDKENLLRGCINARLELMNKCFNGGDQGHKDQVENLQKAADNCAGLHGHSSGCCDCQVHPL